jgi:hypothetical protein
VRTLEALEVRYTTEPEAISPAVVLLKITTLYTATVVCGRGRAGGGGGEGGREKI